MKSDNKPKKKSAPKAMVRPSLSFIKVQQNSGLVFVSLSLKVL